MDKNIIWVMFRKLTIIASYQIINTLGYVIKEGKGTSTDISDAPSGLYIIKIKGVDTVSSLSIMKQ